MDRAPGWRHPRRAESCFRGALRVRIWLVGHGRTRWGFGRSGVPCEASHTPSTEARRRDWARFSNVVPQSWHLRRRILLRSRLGPADSEPQSKGTAPSCVSRPAPFATLRATERNAALMPLQKIKALPATEGSRISMAFGEYWGERWDLNPRPSVPQTDALPTELRSPLHKNHSTALRGSIGAHVQIRSGAGFSRAQPRVLRTAAATLCAGRELVRKVCAGRHIASGGSAPGRPTGRSERGAGKAATVRGPAAAVLAFRRRGQD